MSIQTLLSLIITSDIPKNSQDDNENELEMQFYGFLNRSFGLDRKGIRGDSKIDLDFPRIIFLQFEAKFY